MTTFAPFLPEVTGGGRSNVPLGVYIHVPFCRVRCGYCDFNTYTASELRGVTRESYAADARAELDHARGALERVGAWRPVSTVFFGGGTPTLLPADALVLLLDVVREEWGLAPDAEVTVEANPDSVDTAGLCALAAGGVTRVSFGMQSAVPHVLAVLDRTHEPSRVSQVVAWAREAGLTPSVDCIYGTPGETLADWDRTLTAALDLGVDHVSAYALTIEPGTALARRVRSGAVAPVDPDMQADMYELADERFSAAGLEWYEVSNWARGASNRSRHNLGYWRGGDWWGIGPGAHGHLAGTRWWNVRHPAVYAARLAAGEAPVDAWERLDSDAIELERILLGLRIRDGLPLDTLSALARHAAAEHRDAGLLDPGAFAAGMVRLTRSGRLLTDVVVRALTA